MKHIQRGFALLAASLLCTTPLTAGMAASAYPQANHPDDGGETYIDASRTAEATAEEDLTIDYPFQSWSEIPFVLTQDSLNSFYQDDDELCLQCKEKGVLTATLTAERPATLAYKIRSSGDQKGLCTVYIDNVVVRKLPLMACGNGPTLYEEMTQGDHTIRWEFTSAKDHYINISEIGAVLSPRIEVSLLEPGSLGTEVLYHVDHLREARDLKVKGTMNDADWGYIKMMTNLCVLDLSEAQISKIPEGLFRKQTHPFLHRVVLPEGLKAIEKEAFWNSNIEEISLPSTLESIGDNAFNSTCLSEISLPESALNLGGSIFRDCRALKKALLPSQLTSIPYSLFNGCTTLTECTLPSNLRTIGSSAFSYCKSFSPTLPESLTRIEGHAFQRTNIKEVRLGNSKLTYLGGGAFQDCQSLIHVELPPSYSTVDEACIFLGAAIQTLVLESPTVVGGKVDDLFNYDTPVPQITLRVPEFAVNAYKLDSYWYNCPRIEGFSTTEVGEWTISQPLVLGARDRFEGCPDVNIVGQGSLKVNGTRKMALGNVYYETNGNDVAQTAQLWSNCDSISVEGALDAGYYVTRNRWYFISLPFNFRPADIAVPEGAQYALRRYDGGARATSGTGQSWTDVEEDETVAAGTGFIFQASQDGWYSFHALDDAAKQYVAANKEFAKALAANPSDVAADRGWNLVGNPYQTYYNVHRLNFTAPITLWNGASRTYEAYSIIDDDVALQPGQAFFVQCPDEVESISFPLEGRQLTAEIESQTAANQMGPGHGGSTRLLLDLSLACGELADRTRVVMNDAAKEAYEATCDAAKFMSDATDVPQLYSLGTDGTRYAINERPTGDGTVRLGFRAGQDGSFALRLTRHEGGRVMLTDTKTGTTADLTAADYLFTAPAGTDEGRFVLSFKSDATTGIGSAAPTDGTHVTATADGITIEGEGTATVYGADGRTLGTYNVQGRRNVSLPAGIYVVRTAQGSVKVTVNR